MSIQDPSPHLAQQQQHQKCDKSYAHRVTHNLPRDMYDKILRHRQTIEAALASEDLHGGRDQPQHHRVGFSFDNVQGSLIIQADQDEDLERANQLINSILSDDSLHDSLGLSDLTTESLLARMETAVHAHAQQHHVHQVDLDTISSRFNKLPLGTASSWDSATGSKQPARTSITTATPTNHPRQHLRYGQLNIEEATRMLLSSPLPNEMSIGAMANSMAANSENSFIYSNQQQQQGHGGQQPRAHNTVAKALSDPYVQYLQQMSASAGDPITNLVQQDRRKLESEDSSYGSDHENNRGPWTNNHEDVSRTASETLGVEFTEYVSAERVSSSASNNPTTASSTSGLKIASTGAVESCPADHYECIEDVLTDPTYQNKVIKALKLGYTEQLLQQAVLKLGRKAGEDQILEELIRLQKTVAKNEESNLVAADVLVNLNDLKNNPRQSDIINLKDDKFVAEGVQLLPIIIDGSNVAMSHGNKERFSCKGIRICVDWFKNRGHKEITVFVPLWRKESSKPETPITDQNILTELEKEKIMSFTHSRQVNGRRIVCHDDRYILNLAVENGGIVVSNDNYRELINEKTKYKEVIEERQLGYSFVKDLFMPPDDPLGRNGPNLDQFLRKKVKLSSQLPQPCPYDKKCTYGNKCKFYHPDRVTNQKSITEKLKLESSQRINEMRAREVHSRDSSPGDPLTRTKSMQPKTVHVVKNSVSRTKSSQPRLWPQPQWPGFDPRMPPPPPRSPWQPETCHNQDLTSVSGANAACSKTGHKKVSRQFSLNPVYDSRIPGGFGPRNDFSKPPPTFPTPHQTVAAASSAQHHHLTITRNASAPEQPAASTATAGGMPERAPGVYPVKPEVHQLTGSPIDLHKTMSWSSDMSGAVSPLIPSSGNVWDNANATGATKDGKDARGSLYYHLTNAGFSEDKVMRAMRDLPNETNAEVICKRIINLDKN